MHKFIHSAPVRTRRKDGVIVNVVAAEPPSKELNNETVGFMDFERVG
jgi:hypothetical protein